MKIIWTLLLTVICLGFAFSQDIQVSKNSSKNEEYGSMQEIITGSKRDFDLSLILKPDLSFEETYSTWNKSTKQIEKQILKGSWSKSELGKILTLTADDHNKIIYQFGPVIFNSGSRQSDVIRCYFVSNDKDFFGTRIDLMDKAMVRATWEK